jgi:filamentous hemagglutinin family protein
MSKKRSLFATFLTYFLSLSLVCQANPKNPKVVSGDVSFKSRGKELQVKAGNKSIIDWESFSIDKGEITKFIQPDQSSAVLNRVTGNNLSELFGVLESNGRVYLINQHGILVGESACINTQGFFASTLDLNNELFLQERDFVFQGNSKAKVINYGTINAWDGDVVLLGFIVENHGLLNAPGGTVGMGAGQEILLSVDSDQKLYIKPRSSEKPLKGSKGVLNTGVIKAIQAELKADGNPFSYAIQQDGAIEATGALSKAGRIFLKADKGEVSVAGTMRAQNSDQTGGEIQILGERLGIWENARIDASGEFGGGKVLIGGDFQGNNPEIFNSTVTVVDKHVEIDVSAGKQGDGGTAIIWADKGVQFSGHIIGHGGRDEGNGGFVEVSGKAHLQFLGRVDLHAPNGKTGDLYLDPQSIEITPIGGALPPCKSGETPLLSFMQSIGNVSMIKGSMLSSALEKCNVTLQANTDIKVLDVVPTPSVNSNSLTLQAGRSILFKKDSLISLNGGDFNATINDPNAIKNDRLSGDASFTMMENSKIKTHGGQVKIHTGNYGDVTVGSLRLSGKNTLIDSGSGNIDVKMAGISKGGALAEGAIVLDDGALLKTTGQGNIHLEGSVPSEAQERKLAGVVVNQSTISTEQGDLHLTGHGWDSQGIIFNESVASTDSGKIDLKGFTKELFSTGISLNHSSSPVLESKEGNIDLYSDSHIIHENNSSIKTGNNGSIKIRSHHGILYMQSETVYSVEDGNISLIAGEDINLGTVVTSPNGSIHVTSLEGKIASVDGSLKNLSGGNAALVSAGDMGSVRLPIKTSLNQLQANADSSGDIFIANENTDLRLKAWNGSGKGKGIQSAVGSVQIRSNQNLLVESPVYAAHGNVNLEGSNISLGEVKGHNVVINASSGSISNKIPQSKISGYHVALMATKDIGSKTDPIATTTHVLQALSKEEGDIHLVNKDTDVNLMAWKFPENSVQATKGSINIQNSTHAIKLVDPIVSEGNLFLNAHTEIQQVNDTSLLKAGQIYLSSGSRIGSVEKPILTQVNNLQAKVVNEGDLYITNVGSDLNLSAWHENGNSVQTKNGSISIENKTHSINMDHPLVSGKNGKVSIVAETNVNLGEIFTEEGEIYVNAVKGRIQSVVNGKTNISGGKVYLSAYSHIGTKETGNINTSVDTLQTVVKNRGDINIENNRSVVLQAWKEGEKSAETSKGEINILAQGNLGVRHPVKTGSDEPIKLTAHKGTILQVNNVLEDDQELYSLKGDLFEKGGFSNGTMIWHKAKKFTSPVIIEKAAITSAFEQKYYLYTFEPDEVFPCMTFVLDQDDCLSICSEE